MSNWHCMCSMLGRVCAVTKMTVVWAFLVLENCVSASVVGSAQLIVPFSLLISCCKRAAQSRTKEEGRERKDGRT